MSGQYSMMTLYDVAEGIIDRCCFAEINSFFAMYETRTGLSYGLLKAFLNSTVAVKYRGGEAPHWGGYDEFSFIFNNNSHFTTTNIRSCYCHVVTPQHRDDINCFFIGVSCTGPYPIDFHTDWSGCVMSKLNCINNSDSDGYFFIANPNIWTTIKESVIAFNANPAKWIYVARTGSGLEIVNSFVVADGEPLADQHISTLSVRVVSMASTYGQFQRNPGRKECNSISKAFSHSFFLYLLSSFLLISQTTLPITLV